jgi:protein gp37
MIRKFFKPGQTTGIQWTNATINFWQGCKKVSPGCKYCYMYRDKTEKYGGDPTDVKKVSQFTIDSKLAELTKPSLIFTCSWSDFFIKEADGWREWAWDIIRRHPQHEWQILTKRPERIKECLPSDWGDGWDNVWLGVSIETSEFMNRAYILSEVPAKIRFISAEPLLERLDFSKEVGLIPNIHWVIPGGESGNEEGQYKYRECEVEWIEKIIQDFKNTPVKVFVKQLGTHLAKQMRLKDPHGGNWKEWPTAVRVRQFPEYKKVITI